MARDGVRTAIFIVTDNGNRGPCESRTARGKQDQITDDRAPDPLTVVRGRISRPFEVQFICESNTGRGEEDAWIGRGNMHSVAHMAYTVTRTMHRELIMKQKTS